MHVNIHKSRNHIFSIGIQHSFRLKVRILLPVNIIESAVLHRDIRRNKPLQISVEYLRVPDQQRN